MKTIIAEQLYTYYEKPTLGNNLVKNFTIVNFIKSALSGAIYQSDNLQDVLDVLPILATTNKYNL